MWACTEEFINHIHTRSVIVTGTINAVFDVNTAVSPCEARKAAAGVVVGEVTTLAIDTRRRGTVINVDLTLSAGEARQTVTNEPVDIIHTCTSIQTRFSPAVVYVNLTQVP